MSGTVAQIKSAFQRSGRDWNQMCQAAMWNLCNWFGHAPVGYESANAAYRASTIVSRDASKASAGDFHYWDIGSDGHVAAQVDSTHVLMGSRHVDTLIGTNVGFTTVARYTALTGARYLGWSHTNGANDFSVTVPAPARTYTVQSGDNLSLIADRLNIKGGWQALYDKNRSKIGSNPNDIYPGMVLTLP